MISAFLSFLLTLFRLKDRKESVEGGVGLLVAVSATLVHFGHHFGHFGHFGHHILLAGIACTFVEKLIFMKISKFMDTTYFSGLFDFAHDSHKRSHTCSIQTIAVSMP